MSKDDTNWMLFCVQCFASEIDGSWDHVVLQTDDDYNICGNCGGRGTAYPLPRAAIESIRKQASWVGKRYYPHEEDAEMNLERMELLKLVDVFPGRTVRNVGDVVKGYWNVTQQLPAGGSQMISVIAENAEHAFQKAHFSSLRYVSAEQLEAQNEAG